MRTITTKTTVCSFDELSNDAKQKAIENLYDLNVGYAWWEFTYDDAKQIGCKIHEFDIDRRNDIRLTCDDAEKTAALILANHGETCDTYKLAKEYLKDFGGLKRDDDGEVLDDYDLEDLNTEFARALGEEYLLILREEYEYQTSEKAIIETIKANEYEFTEDGKIF